MLLQGTAVRVQSAVFAMKLGPAARCLWQRGHGALIEIAFMP